MSNPALKSHAYRKARAIIINSATHCALCGQPLDPTAAPNTTWSTTVDHIIPISHGGNPTNLNNLRAAHKGCNTSRGNTTTTGKGVKRRRPSRATSMTTRMW